MRLPFCERCKICNVCEKDFDLFEEYTGNKRIPPESFCKEQHKKNNIDINNFYKNVIIENIEDVECIQNIFPEIEEDIKIFTEEQEKKYEELCKKSNITEDNRKKIEKSTTIMLTEKCNLACEYCYERFSNNLLAQTMSKEVIEKSVDFLFDIYVKNAKGIPNIVWDIIGGEIFVEFEKLKYISDYIIKKYTENNLCPKKYITLSLCTNGTLFTDEVKEWCIKTKSKVAHLSVSISLDGIKECHDICRNKSFDKVMTTFDWWRKTFPYDNIKGTVSPKTLKYLFKNVEFYVDTLKLPRFYINPTFEGPWSNDDVELFFEELIKCADFFLEKYPDYDVLENSNLFMNLKVVTLNMKRKSNWCGSGVYMRAISPNGDIYPCLRAITSNYLPIGNVISNKTSLEKIDKNKIIPFYFYTSFNEEPECQKCAISMGCPTCVMQWYEDTGDIFKRSKKICSMTKARYFASKYFMENSKLYKEYL